MAQTENEQFFSYKGKPLVKNKNVIYYGSMLDDYVVMLTVKSTTKKDELELSDKILVQLMRTDRTLNPLEIIVKSSERDGIYNAMEIADIWLTKALSE